MIKRISLVACLAASLLACKKDAKDQGAASGSATTIEPAGGGGGSASWEERRHKRAQMMHDKLDADHDGKLTPAELGAAEGRMKFDDPAAVDTDHDGNITVEELEAAMKARGHHRADGGSAGGNGSGATDDDH